MSENPGSGSRGWISARNCRHGRVQGLGQDRAPPPSIYCSGAFRALGQRRWRGCDSLFINQRRLTWPEANKEAIGRRGSLRKKRSRRSPLPQAKRARRRDGSRTSRPAKRNRNGSRDLTTPNVHHNGLQIRPSASDNPAPMIDMKHPPQIKGGGG